MSTFLQLVQDLHREVGAAGVKPAAVTSQTGEAERLVGWIKEADLYVQNLWSDWKFLWDQFDTGNVTTASVNSLSKPANFGHWDFETFRIIEPGQTESNPIDVVEYHDIRGETLDTSESIPNRVIVMPDDNLQFEPVPDAAYTILADYYAEPTPLAANADVSAIPEKYHPVILGRAMILYANHENAPEIKDQGSEIYIEQLARLENKQLPNKKDARFKSGGFFEVIAE